MGPIVDRTKEQFSSSDVAIIHARRLLARGNGQLNAGRPVVGTIPGIDHRDVLPLDTVLPSPDAHEPAVQV